MPEHIDSRGYGAGRLVSRWQRAAQPGTSVPVGQKDGFGLEGPYAVFMQGRGKMEAQDWLAHHRSLLQAAYLAKEVIWCYPLKT